MSSATLTKLRARGKPAAEHPREQLARFVTGEAAEYVGLTRPEFYGAAKLLRVKPAERRKVRRGSPHNLYDRRDLDWMKERWRRDPDQDGSNGGAS